MQTYLQRLRAFGAKLIPCQGMTLRCKAIGTVVLPVILLAIAISLLITHIVSRGFESAEAVSAVQSASQVDGMMSEELERLRISATDWAQNEPALRLELGTCTTSGIQVLVVYDRDGLPQMQTSCVDASGRNAVQIPSEWRAALADSSVLREYRRQGISGILNTTMGAWLIGTSPVIGQGALPDEGMVLVARRVDDAFLVRLRELTHLPIAVIAAREHSKIGNIQAQGKVEELGKSWIARTGSETLAVFTPYEDLVGETAFVLRVDLPRMVYQEGRSTLKLLTLSFAVICILMTVLMLTMLERLVLSRVAILKRSVLRVHSDAGHAESIALSGRDELADVAHCINAIVEELKRSNAELVASDSRLRGMLAAIQAGVFVIDTTTNRIVEANPEAVEIIGGWADQIVGSEPERFLLIDPETICENSDEGPRYRKAQGVLRKLNGDELYVLIATAEVMMLDRCCRIESFIDISAMKEASDENRRTKEFLDAVVSNLPVAVVIRDAETHRFTLWNKASERLFGIAAERVIGARDHDFFPKERADAILEEELKTAAQRSAREVIEQVRHPQRGDRLLRTLKVPLHDETGVLRYILSISEDMTERIRAEEDLRASEERFRSFVESAGSDEWVWECDAEGRFTYVSPQVEKILGYDWFELVGHHPSEFLESKEAVRLNGFLKDKIVSRERFHRLEFRMRRKDGQEIMVEGSGIPIAGRGIAAGMRGTCRDVTIRRQVEAEWRRARDEAWASNIELKEAVTRISEMLLIAGRRSQGE